MSAQEELKSLAQELQLPILIDFLGENQEIVRVTLNRPKQANSIPAKYHILFSEFWTKFEGLPELRVAILTGTGKLFSAGADLKSWLQDSSDADPATSIVAANGFMGISNRSNRKPIILALNGSSFGGGTEALLNCDLVVALRSATICLPEVRVGVTALAGALPRLGRTLSLQQANELALVAEPISAETAKEWGIVNRVVDTPQDVQREALELAKKIVLGSPEGIYVSQRGVRRGYEETRMTLSEGTQYVIENEYKTLTESPNHIEGLIAFSEKRKPKWTTKL